MKLWAGGNAFSLGVSRQGFLCSLSQRKRERERGGNGERVYCSRWVCLDRAGCSALPALRAQGVYLWPGPPADYSRWSTRIPSHSLLLWARSIPRSACTISPGRRAEQEQKQPHSLTRSLARCEAQAALALNPLNFRTKEISPDATSSAASFYYFLSEGAIAIPFHCSQRSHACILVETQEINTSPQLAGMEFFFTIRLVNPKREGARSRISHTPNSSDAFYFRGLFFLWWKFPETPWALYSSKCEWTRADLVVAIRIF